MPTITPERMSSENVERIALPQGVAGTDKTIDVMSIAAMGKYGAQSPIIRNKTLDVIRAARVPERDKAGEVRAIHEFVKKHLRYVNDPLSVEFVTYPETLLLSRTDGDCDDHAVLEAAMLGSIGIQTRFVTYGIKGGPPSHVALHANINNQWLPLDPIVKQELAGWEVPDYTSRTLYGVNTPVGYAKKKLSISGLIGFVIVGGILLLLHKSHMKRIV